MHIYPDKPGIIKSSKNKEGHYYNHLKSTRYKKKRRFKLVKTHVKLMKMLRIITH